MTPQLPTMTPQEFAGRWYDAGFGERQGAQSFFNDLCSLVGHATPHTRAIGGTFQFAFILPKPAYSGNTRVKNRKAVKPRHKTHADSANCKTAANAAGPRLAEKQRRELTQHTPPRTDSGRGNSTSTTTAANEQCPASYRAPTAGRNTAAPAETHRLTSNGAMPHPKPQRV